MEDWVTIRNLKSRQPGNGFMPTRSLPGHPWSKGKVEKSFSYLETHFIAGAEFEDFFDLQSKLKIFQTENSMRIHSVTKSAAIYRLLLYKLSKFFKVG